MKKTVYALIIDKNKSLDFNSIEEVRSYLVDSHGLSESFVDDTSYASYNKNDERDIHFLNGVYLNIRKYQSESRDRKV